MRERESISVRLDKNSADILDNVTKSSGLSKSEVIRNLINYEHIHIRYGEKAILERISKVYDDINRDTLEVMGYEQRIYKVCENLLSAYNNQPTLSGLNDVAMSAKMAIDCILQDYWHRKLKAEQELKQVVNFHTN